MDSRQPERECSGNLQMDRKRARQREQQLINNCLRLGESDGGGAGMRAYQLSLGI